MANHVVSFLIRAKDGATTVFKSITSGAKALVSGLLRNGANIQAWGQMIAGVAHKVGAAFGHLWGAIRESMRFETLTGQFKVLLGSMDAARERMASLAKFAEVTPFQLDEIARASRTLTVMSQDALGTEWALKLVGDAAAATGGSIEELAMWVGRAYAMIAAGKPFGEAAMRLTELGALTPEVRDKMERLQAAGASSAEVWTALTDHLEGFGGAMEQLSLTGDGLVSTLSDNWTAAIRTFGDAFLEETKSGIVFMINKLKELKDSGAIKEWADAAVEALKPLKDLIIAIFGTENTRATAMTAAWDYLKAVFDYGAEVLKAAGTYIGDTLYAKAIEAKNKLTEQRFGERALRQIARFSSPFGFIADRYVPKIEPGSRQSDNIAEEEGLREEARATFSRSVKDAAAVLQHAGKQAAGAISFAASVAEANAGKAATQPSSTPEEKPKDDGKQKAIAALNAAKPDVAELTTEEKRLIKEQEAAFDRELKAAFKAACDAEEDAAKERQKAAKAEAKAAKEAAKAAKERLEELEKRAKDSDYEREQRKKEEKEAKKKEKEDKRLNRRARELLKKFATRDDPNAFLRMDFDERRIGHASRAVRDWMLATKQNQKAQQDAAKAEAKVDETNALLKDIRDQNKELLSLS